MKQEELIALINDKAEDKQFVEVLKLYEELDAKFPDYKNNNPYYYILLADAYLAIEDYEKAELNALKVAKINPEMAMDCFLGDLKLKLNQLEMALDFYEKASKLESDIGHAHLGMARVYFTQGKEDEMFKCLKLAGEKGISTIEMCTMAADIEDKYQDDPRYDECFEF